ncbi:MAG: hypothetical protein K5922_06515 [Clostridiales bacterium]|nr:hypothetical protein [Clostridiales bacterium]
MLLAAGYFLCFQALGLAGIRLLLPRRRVLDRIWLGMSLGLLEEMWLPALFAFVEFFDAKAHLMALGAGVLLTGLLWLGRDRSSPRRWDDQETALARRMLFWVLPLTVLSAYLQYTHVMRVDGSGNWNVGQCTYGDLPMHLSFITGLVGKRFPADYPFYPGHRLSYPFLADSLSSSFLLMGSSLQAATIVPAVFMMALCYMGVMVLAREMTTGKKTILLASALFFLNGGLGFLYDFDQAAGFNSSGGLNVADRIRNILEGYYKTPTNQPDPNNLRWSNVICDLMLPQRTILGGWAAGIPCFYLLETLFRPDRRDGREAGRGLPLLGVWAGALPLIHTHTFVALALCSLGVMLYDLIHGDKAQSRSRGSILLSYAVYGGIAAACALPQLIGFTFAQAFQPDAARNSFMRFQFNWVNNPGGNGMRDFYIWFYVKNIGIPFLMLLLALIEKDPKQRRIFSGMVLTVLAAELIRFQPNEYDNNKLLYPAWMLGCMIVSNWSAKVWRMLKGLRSRPVIAAGAAVVIFLSAALTVARECVSSYQAFGAGAVEAGEFVRDETDPDAVFITGTQHLNPVSAIAGRTVVCGPDLWLYWHGFDTSERKLDLLCFYEDPETWSDIPEKYGADYIYVSSYERSSYEVDETALDRIYEKVFENYEATVYRIR